jgi:hypothetical protein
VEGNEDLFYEVSDEKMNKLIAQKFRQPRPFAIAALQKKRSEATQVTVASTDASVVVEEEESPAVRHPNKNNDIAHAIECDVTDDIVLDLDFLKVPVNAQFKDATNNIELDIAAVTFDDETHLEDFDEFDYTGYPFNMEDV